MNANLCTCHPGEGRKASPDCDTWLNRCHDSISSKNRKSFDEKTRGTAKTAGLQRTR